MRVELLQYLPVLRVASSSDLVLPVLLPEEGYRQTEQGLPEKIDAWVVEVECRRKVDHVACQLNRPSS